jgi:NAD(P)-dependent dehydrogenase (short-subunit alcohol dehydrogenase family)
MKVEFKGKTILITGAAGYLGRELAREYAQSQAAGLVLMDQEEKKGLLEEMREELALAVPTWIYTADLRKPGESHAVVEQMTREGIAVDILVNNAGINRLVKAQEMTEEVWDSVLDTNLKGSFFLTREVAEASLLRRGGNIVFLSSQHGVVGNLTRTAYCASKTGLLGLVRALVAEWSGLGIRVNSVAPTFILNEANQEYLNHPHSIRTMRNKIPLHRYATVEDVAHAVLFLTSDLAAMINGHNLLVDGGYTVL